MTIRVLNKNVIHIILGNKVPHRSIALRCAATRMGI